VADELCDRVAFIVDGQIRLVERPRDLKLRYGAPRVRLEYLDSGGATAAQEFALSGLGRNEAFLSVLSSDRLQTIHTLEATLEDVFIQVTGRILA
jgi:fluoroquinolone transport system ATP-binding protein